MTFLFGFPKLLTPPQNTAAEASRDAERLGAVSSPKPVMWIYPRSNPGGFFGGMEMTVYEQQTLCDGSVTPSIGVTAKASSLHPEGHLDAPEFIAAGACRGIDISPGNSYGYRYASQQYVWRHQ